MRSGLFLPIFDELADPVLVARLATLAEDAGWHGIFVWATSAGVRRSSMSPTRGSR
jgi:hypothetical protein